MVETESGTAAGRVPLVASARRAAMYCGFAATGVGLSLPGALMPVLLRHWAMGDARGGVLLFCFYASAPLGSLAVRGRRLRWVLAGSLITMAASAWLGLGGGWTAMAAIAIYGFGLGSTITSISLLQSQRFPGERRLELTRLNLVWAAGAALGPWLALRRASVFGNALRGQHAILIATALFAAFAAWVTLFEREDSSEEAAVVAPPRLSILQVPWPLLALVFFATGVEAAASGWLTAYAQRAGESLRLTIGAGTLLWTGALAARALHSTRWSQRLPERAVVGGSIAMVAAALAVLVAWPAGVGTLIAAGALGFGTGPLYPLLVAAVLRHREQSAIFVLAGIGASTLPLLTGAVAGWTHSLRAGLGVPLCAAAVMLVLWATYKESPTSPR
jgi:FHS family glucose/mannose:H+ symporter-like MFS transporter